MWFLSYAKEKSLQRGLSRICYEGKQGGGVPTTESCNHLKIWYTHFAKCRILVQSDMLLWVQTRHLQSLTPSHGYLISRNWKGEPPPLSIGATRLRTWQWHFCATREEDNDVRVISCRVAREYFKPETSFDCVWYQVVPVGDVVQRRGWKVPLEDICKLQIQLMLISPTFDEIQATTFRD